jgi:hypothetical protein
MKSVGCPKWLLRAGMRFRQANGAGGKAALVEPPFIHLPSPAMPGSKRGQQRSDPVRIAPNPSCEEPLSPNVSACRLGPRTVNSLHAGYRVECDTSGLGDLLAMPMIGFSQRRF